MTQPIKVHFSLGLSFNILYIINPVIPVSTAVVNPTIGSIPSCGSNDKSTEYISENTKQGIPKYTTILLNDLTAVGLNILNLFERYPSIKIISIVRNALVTSIN